MQSDSAEPFLDNWTYLRTELAWLDRVLGLAIARHRKDAKEIDRFAHSRVDRITSHWWKGLVSLEGDISYDSPAEMPRRRSTKIGYQQQIDIKIQATQQQGIQLGLPTLCTRLQLSPFEKNLVLMALAPEVNRRYGRIYSYLQDMEQAGASGLPTVDLILRIFCRTDGEWQTARQCFTIDSALIHHQLLELHPLQQESLLTRLVKLSDPLVSYLLASQPNTTLLERLLSRNREASAASVPTAVFNPVAVPGLRPSFLSSASVPVSWSDLVLPDALITTLQHLCHRVMFASQVDEIWGFQAPEITSSATAPGTFALLVGAPGTGKTMVAHAIAQTLKTPLVWANLSLIKPADYADLLQAIAAQSPKVLLLKSAQLWLGRTSQLADAELNQFLNLRRQTSSITLLSVTQKQTAKPHWQQQMNSIVEFPIPDASSRLTLWKRAFPATAPLETDINWEWLAQQFRLTGGEIRAIAREAAFYAIAESSAKLGIQHLIQACKAIKGRGQKAT